VAEDFAYKATKSGKVFISWRGKQVKILAGKEAEKFLALAAGADESEAQLLMAKRSGNFKRGNER
jgi:hypothetical protein